MAARGVFKNKKLSIRPDKDVKPAKQIITINSKAPRNQATPHGKAKIKSNEDFTLVKKDTKDVQANAKHKRQTQIRRVSFVVRLTLNDDNQFERTEIECISTKSNIRNHNFLNLDGEQLVAFMKACIGPETMPKVATRIILAPEKFEEPALERLGVIPTLVVSNIQLFSRQSPNAMGLTLRAEEPFIVQTHFQIEGEGAKYLTNQELFYKMKVYVNEITTGKFKLLVVHRARLIQNLLKYTVPTEVPGLSHGFYRFLTMITLGDNLKVAGYHDGPIISAL